MLHRFAPLGARDPEIETLAAINPRRMSRGMLFARGLLGGVIAFSLAALAVALLEAVKRQRLAPWAGFDLYTPLADLFLPANLSDWLSLFGVTLFSVVFALATAATAFSRSKK
jgi:PAT family beta-lactamase induction signal transducer AmpG